MFLALLFLFKWYFHVCLESGLFRQGLCRKGSFLWPMFPVSSPSSAAGVGRFLGCTFPLTAVCSCLALWAHRGKPAPLRQPLSVSLPYNCCWQGRLSPDPATYVHRPEPTAGGEITEVLACGARGVKTQLWPCS